MKTKQRIITMMLALVAMLMGTQVMAAVKAYALYDSHSNPQTLTFYYDDLWNTTERIGKKYDLNEDYSKPGWITDNCYIQKVVFHESFIDVRPTSTYCWFSENRDLDTFVGFENLNTSCVTDMSFMFSGCINLISVELSGFDTSSVESMNSMFSGCNSLESLDLSSFDTSNVRYMNSMFSTCVNLKKIIVGKSWSTTNVEMSSSMFSLCNNLVGGAGTGFDSQITDATYAIADGLKGKPGYLTAVSYGISVSGKAVTFANLYDVLGDETVYYDDDVNILTLNHASVSSIRIASNAPNGLKIDVVGDCSVNMSGFLKGDAFSTSIENTTIEGAGKLTIVSERGIGIKIDRPSFATLMVKNVELDVTGYTAGIMGTASGSKVYSNLGFDNTNCTVRRTEGEIGSVGYINQIRLKNCTMTSGVLDNYVIKANPMVIKRGSGINTGLNQVTRDKSQMTNDEWYTIDGRKLRGKPNTKGVFIHNGRAVFLDIDKE